MQLALGTVCLLALTGSACRRDSVFFVPETNLTADTRGVALYDGATLAHAGMMDTTCEFDVEMGLVTADYNLPGDQDSVLDGFRNRILAQSSEGLHVIDRGVIEDVGAVDVIDARLSSAGVVALATDCSVRWLDDGTRVPLSGDICTDDTGFDVTPAGDIAFVSGADLLRVGPTEASVLGDGVDHMLWDADSDALLIARGSVVSALESDGLVKWEHDVGEDVEGLLRLPGELVGAVVPGRGIVVMLDIDGALHSDATDTPDRGDVTSSDAGDTIAFLNPHEITVYSVSVGTYRPSDTEPQDLFD